MGSVVRSLVVLLAGLVLMGADDDYVRLTLETPAAAPYRVVRYEVSRRGRTTTAVHRRQIPGYDEPLHAMSLMTRHEAARAWEIVEESAASELVDATAPGAARGPAGTRRDEGLSWKVELSLGGQAHSFTVLDPANQPDRRYHRLVSGLQDVVEEVAGRLHFKNVFISRGRMGWVNIVAVPAARVTIDGFETRRETPLYGYELKAGKHRIRLDSLEGELRREYEIRVERGGTTHLRVDIR